MGPSTSAIFEKSKTSIVKNWCRYSVQILCRDSASKIMTVLFADGSDLFFAFLKCISKTKCANKVNLKFEKVSSKVIIRNGKDKRVSRLKWF